MGQAKRRGTLEQRQALAELRNEALAAAINNGGNPVLTDILTRHGIQRTATKLTAAGLINAPRPGDVYQKPS